MLRRARTLKRTRTLAGIRTNAENVSDVYESTRRPGVFYVYADVHGRRYHFELDGEAADSSVMRAAPEFDTHA